MKPSPVIIKKYGNRRLYDTSGSGYVNLEDIARFVREGKEVQIVDAKTGRDLTRVIADADHHRRCQGQAHRPAARTAAPVDHRIR